MKKVGSFAGSSCVIYSLWSAFIFRRADAPASNVAYPLAEVIQKNPPFDNLDKYLGLVVPANFRGLSSLRMADAICRDKQQKVEILRTEINVFEKNS